LDPMMEMTDCRRTGHKPWQSKRRKYISGPASHSPIQPGLDQSTGKKHMETGQHKKEKTKGTGNGCFATYGDERKKNRKDITKTRTGESSKGITISPYAKYP